MPDGDKIYGGLSQAYEKPYEQLCEWHYGPDEIANNFLVAVRTDLNHYGTVPIAFLFEVASQLEQLPQEPLFRLAVDWQRESRDIERKARKYLCDKRGMAIAVAACKSRLRAFQRDPNVPVGREAMVQSYLQRLFEAQFEGRRPLLDNYQGVVSTTLMDRIQQVRPYVYATLDLWGSRIARTGRIDRLRRHMPKREPINADTDLLALT